MNTNKKNSRKVNYEWAIEQLGITPQGDFEVVDYRNDGCTTIPDLTAEPLAKNEQLTLVSEVYNEYGSISEREVAVVTSKGLPPSFDSNGVIPKIYHDQVSKYPLSMHSDIAKLA